MLNLFRWSLYCIKSASLICFIGNAAEAARLEPVPTEEESQPHIAKPTLAKKKRKNKKKTKITNNNNITPSEQQSNQTLSSSSTAGDYNKEVDQKTFTLSQISITNALRGYLETELLKHSETQEKAEQLYKKGLKLAKEDDTKSKNAEALKSWYEAAMFGNSLAMLSIGDLFRTCAQPDLIQAYKWYFLGFEMHWIETGKHSKRALDSFNTLQTKEAAEFLKIYKELYYIAKGSTPIIILNNLRRAVAEKLLNKYDEHSRNYLSYFSQDERRFLRARISLHSKLDFSKYNLGLLYLEGSLGRRPDGNPNFDKAAEYFECSNTPEGMCQLGTLYVKGLIKLDLSQEKRIEKAKELFEKSGTPHAKHNLGTLYKDVKIGKELSIEKLLEEQKKCFEQSGLPESLFCLGERYQYSSTLERLEGLSEEERFEKARNYYEQSNTSYAKCRLGKLYQKRVIGKELSEEERLEKARDYFEEAGTPEANCKLGKLYQKGHIGKELSEEQRFEKARNYYEQSGTPEANCKLGKLYQKGHIGKELSEEERLEKARDYFEQSGTLEAKCNLGILYQQGLIGKNLSETERLEKARGYFEKSRTPKANYFLAVLSFKESLGSNFSQEDRLLAAYSYAESALAGGFEPSKKLLEEISQLIKLESQASKESPLEQIPETGTLTEMPIESVESLPSNQNSNETVFQRAEDSETKQQIKAIKKKIREKAQSITFSKAKKIPSTSAKQTQKKEKGFQLEFVSPKIEDAFKSLISKQNGSQTSKKLREVIKDIFNKPWGTDGVGKPELLKQSGLWSRRLNHKDRLVYKVETGKIIIHSCSDHY